MSNYRRFNLNFLWFVFPSLLFLGAFNFIIDPYGVWNYFNFPLNKVRIAKDNQARLFKAIDIIRIQPEKVFLGSSRTEIGLDTSHPVFVEQKTSYNLGLPGISIYEMTKYFEHLIANQSDVETIVISLDFMMFNNYKLTNPKPDFVESRLGKKHLIWQDFLDVTFSIDALDDSIKTVFFNYKPHNDSYYLDNGMRYNPQEKVNTNKFKITLREYLDHKDKYNDYTFSAPGLNNLKKIIEICREKNIKVKIFISPAHVIHWEALYESGLWSIFEKWKREIVKITPIWDFSTYNSITTEDISEEMENYWDSHHYTKEVGDLILNRLFSYEEENIPDDFGILITPENVESHLAQIREQRKLWVKNNPQRVKLVKDLKQKVENN